jgi:hypothetical protein
MKLLNQNLFFAGAMSLGDAIVFNAIIHRMAAQADILYLPVLRQYFDTLNCLYQDYDNIVVVAFDNPEQQDEFVQSNNLARIVLDVLTRTSIFIPNLAGYVTATVNWDRQVYEFFDIPYSARYREFKFPKHVEGADELYNRLTEGEENYCLFNQQTGAHPAGLNIELHGFRAGNNFPPMKIIEINDTITSNMLQYVKLIENAKEIHTVNTSFYWLVDSLIDRTNATLYYHDRRADSIQQINSRWNNYRWITVSYPEKF